MNDEPPKRRQQAYHDLEDLISEADDLLDSGVHNERNLKQAYSDAEDLLFELDEIEYELLREIERAENGGGSDG